MAAAEDPGAVPGLEVQRDLERSVPAKGDRGPQSRDPDDSMACLLADSNCFGSLPSRWCWARSVQLSAGPRLDFTDPRTALGSEFGFAYCIQGISRSSCLRREQK